MEQSQFLEGVRVVDLTRLLPGPFATLLLADMGADVVKVEDPMKGDYARYYPPLAGATSAYFQALNRDKRAVTLNLKHDEGPGLLRRLLEDADVLVEGFRPGVLSRLGLEPEELCREFPELIICSITGFGQTGPKRDDAGHDANYLALSGLLERNGRRGESPHVPGFQVADLGGGSLYAALGITSALFHRERTGKGTHLDISMTEGALSFLSTAVTRNSAGDLEERGDGMLSGGLPSYRVYPTADERHLAVAALEPKFWDPFVEAIGAEELKSKGMLRGEEGRRVARRLAEVIESQPLDYWIEQLESLDVCVEPVLRVDEVVEHELHRARDMLFELQGLTHVRTPLASRDRQHAPAPAQGEHNEEVFGAVGVDARELQRLDEDGVI